MKVLSGIASLLRAARLRAERSGRADGQFDPSDEQHLRCLDGVSREPSEDSDIRFVGIR